MNRPDIETEVFAAASPVLAVPAQVQTRGLLPGVSRQLADVHHD